MTASAWQWPIHFAPPSPRQTACTNVSTEGNRAEASAREASRTDYTPLSSSVSLSSAGSTAAIFTRLTPLSSKLDRPDHEDLTKKVPSPRSVLVLPSPKMAS